MIARIRQCSILAIVTVTVMVVGPVQAQSADPIAYVTAVTGGGATRLNLETSVTLDGTAFAPEDNGIRLGESVTTIADGTAVMVMPRRGAMTFLQPATRLEVEAGPDWFGGESLVLKLVQGRATFIQKTPEPQFIVLGESGAASGSVAIREGSVFVTARDGTVTFTVLRGTAAFVPGPIPDTRPDELAGAVELTAGQSISTNAPDTPVPYDAEAAAVVCSQLDRDTYAFGVSQSTQWVKRAERGDFTPVRARETRATAGLVGSEFTPTQAFDQPQQLLAVTAPQGAAVTAVRTIVSPAQSLVESGIPGSVIAGQRFRRSLIIGSPGTTGSGPLIVNPNAELLVRLAGR